MATTTVQPKAKQPERVVVTNPVILDRVAEAVRVGMGRNLAEAAGNLINAGFDALRDRQTTAAKS